MIKLEIDLSEFKKLDLEEGEKMLLLRFACFHMNEGKPYIQLKSGEKPPGDQFYIYSDGGRTGTMYIPSYDLSSSIPVLDFDNSPHFFRRKGEFFIHNDVETALSNLAAFVQKCFGDKIG